VYMWNDYVLKKDSTPHELAQVLSAVYDMVHLGDTYFMASNIEDGMLQAASNLPQDVQVHKESFPSTRGFMFLEHPLPPLLTDKDGSVYGDVTAFSWWYAQIEDTDQWGMVLVAWSITNNLYQPCLYLKILDGDTVLSILGLDEAVQEDDKPIITLVSFLVATFNFLEQQLLEAAITALPRQQLRQAVRKGHATTVNVIRLRRKYTQHPTDPNVAPTSYDFQWLVRGHWRKQPYRSKGPDFYKHIFIQPYVKGPDDKPLKGTDRVYAIVR